MNRIHRRSFLSSLAAIPAVAATGMTTNDKAAVTTPLPVGTKGLKTSLNAFSFNVPLTNGIMTIDDMLVFSAGLGFDAVDITGYYFKGYPQVPTDEYLFNIKRKAHSLGLAISGTGVRNDFTIADKAKREQEIVLVKNWIEIAAKIGAPVIRIFAGTQKNEGIAKEQVRDWMLKDLQTCVEYGKQHGVIIGLQNHNDYIQTADEVNAIIELINSPWLGLILDTGSYRVHDPYEEIEKSIKHAVNWQIKENIFINGTEVETDLNRLMKIITASGYKGYLPVETLGAGDAKAKITALYTKLKKVLA